jgi:ribosomal protein S16
MSSVYDKHAMEFLDWRLVVKEQRTTRQGKYLEMVGGCG